jgi:hypothetical protein
MVICEQKLPIPQKIAKNMKKAKISFVFLAFTKETLKIC